ncbi:PaaX family transcriptional regulator C-terminal domain-containing protein [Roseibium sp. SCPC15]|uniref:PaaX family transcriptional regulator C-terminal domain-containing protein n=1 Tax=Roseibium sp. SCP15 TaxID=3141376 RepID=UPI00333BD0D8
MSFRADAAVSRLLEPYPPKAAQLIVTIYGDIVEPRGGVLWMGDLIGLCAGYGVNESLVRTAVSRLVSKGQLEGQREGRRSFYALTAPAREEYHLAAELFFGAPDEECDWIFTYCPHAADQLTLKKQGFVSLGGHMFAGADRPGRSHPGVAFKSRALSPGSDEFRQLVINSFGLGPLAAEYHRFLKNIEPLADEIHSVKSGQSALLLRVALVHAYRHIRLRDPRLPNSVLPQEWPGSAARQQFAELYIALSKLADAHIGQSFLNQAGPLPARPQPVVERLSSLAA